MFIINFQADSPKDFGIVLLMCFLCKCVAPVPCPALAMFKSLGLTPKDGRQEDNYLLLSGKIEVYS